MRYSVEQNVVPKVAYDAFLSCEFYLPLQPRPLVQRNMLHHLIRFDCDHKVGIIRILVEV